MLCCMGTMIFAGAGVFQFAKSIKDNPVYLDVQKRLRDSPQANEVLGKPIETAGLPITNINAQLHETHYDLQFEVRGPKGRARVLVSAIEMDRKITYQRLELLTPQGEHVELRDKSELPDAPPEQVDPSNPAPHDEPMPDNPEDE
jgi:hypothetical protein